MGRVLKIGSKLLTFDESIFDLSRWTRVGDFLVAPEYLHPIQIGLAAEIARLNGCELPTKELVDLVWEEADMKLEPQPLKHNGTAAQMASELAYKKHSDLVAKQLNGRPYRLLAGTHKDIIKNSSGKVGLYGWHKHDGKVVQPPFFGHGIYWIDYSQGLRLVKRVAP